MTRSVLLVTPLWTRDGGVGTHVEASAAALARAGVDVHVLAVRDELGQPPAGVTVHAVRRAVQDASSRPSAASATRSRASYSVIHTHQFDDPAADAYLRRRAPLVEQRARLLGVHLGRALLPPRPGMPARAWPGLRAATCCCAAVRTRATRAGCPAATGARRTLRASLRDARPDDLLLARDRPPHGRSTASQRRAIVPLFSTVPVAHGSGHEGRRRVVFAGRLVRPKGVDVLIRAARDVDARVRDLRQRQARSRRCAGSPRAWASHERVRFRGWLGPQQLARELAEASVVAIPSLWPEPFGLVGIEALAAGRPVVASATGGVEDWLEHGVNGLCVPAGDARALASALSASCSTIPSASATMGEAGTAVGRASASPSSATSRRCSTPTQTAGRSWRTRDAAWPDGVSTRDATGGDPERRAGAALHLAVLRAGHDADGDPRGQARSRASPSDWDVDGAHRGERRPEPATACASRPVASAPAAPAARRAAPAAPEQAARAAGLARRLDLLGAAGDPRRQARVKRDRSERDRRVHDALLRRARRPRAGAHHRACR